MSHTEGDRFAHYPMAALGRAETITAEYSLRPQAADPFEQTNDRY
jgi:hypothetical protein